MRNAFADTLLEIGQRDSRLVVLVGDISHGILQAYAKACPGRYFNVGILEPTIVSMSAGLARTGLLPVAHTIAPFITERSAEQIKLDFCYQQIGGTIISVGSAFDYAGLGCSHHCYDDLALLKGFPNTEVIYPAMPQEFRTLFKHTYSDGLLTYIRIPGTKHGVELQENQIFLGRGVKIRDGSNLTMLAAGPQLKNALIAADLLLNEGVNAEVLYFHTLKPFDNKIIRESTKKTHRLLVVEEHSQYGGFGDEALRATCNISDIKYKFINIPDAFIREYGTYKEICDSLGLSPRGIVKSAKELLTM